VIALTVPVEESSTAVAVAPEPPPPTIWTFGAVVYGPPGLNTVMELTSPLLTVAVASARL